jgi:molybdopterin-guanine dinucleotide biosynthesis protein A
VLAGGKSSRFGQDKALALYNGTTLLERAVNLLTQLDLKPIVVTRRGAEYSFVRASVIYDKLYDLGPLGGIYTAMTVFPGTPFLAVTCDMPALTPSALEPLVAAYAKSRKLTYFKTPAQPCQPFPGVYGPELLPGITSRILIGRLGVQEFIRSVPETNVLDYDGSPEIFTNVNFRQDLERLPA